MPAAAGRRRPGQAHCRPPVNGSPAALGYAEESGIPYNIGLIKNRYIGRTFIQPSQTPRQQSVQLKFNPLPTILKDKSLIVIDDSIVRGTTASHLVAMLREAGARQVHMRITCPPILHPCHMGVDMATHDELIASRFSVLEIQKELGTDSLYFLSIEGMMKAINSQSGYCNACFHGQYPFELNQYIHKAQLETLTLVKEQV